MGMLEGRGRERELLEGEERREREREIKLTVWLGSAKSSSQEDGWISLPTSKF